MTIIRVDEQSKKQDRKNKNGSMKRCEFYSNKGGNESDVDDGVKRFHGDGLVVRMHSNHRTLEITGDGCWIVLSKNSGSVHVVGDGCRLHVNHNVGDIEYTGDGGRVLLGPESSKEKVKFVGDGGKVIRDSSLGTEPIKLSKNRRNKETICVQHVTRKIVRKTPRCEEYNDKRVKNQESLENMTNEGKETTRDKCKINEEQRKSSRHLPTIKKIITKIQSNDPCVRKRMGDSSLIINFRGDNCSNRKYIGDSGHKCGDSIT
ncbi:uncharacterized protein LOC109854170 [Pseudomyrmex gracilis]|uniref:uncharacterized protein LOC109854170 n=1 Tax=Pseudomyrmex gracilis TaxID=219809 RepID=UPI000995189D|nr:uncharacterized protein LOC109854170 [Pseudomyrmex gracilis]